MTLTRTERIARWFEERFTDLGQWSLKRANALHRWIDQHYARRVRRRLSQRKE